MAKKNGLGRGLSAILDDNSITENGHGDIQKLRISLIEPKADQPRQNFGSEALAQLADSIAAAAEKEGETVNVFACGGDGTIQEIAKGLLNHPNARLGIVPVGSGNDYVRCFNHPEHFMNMELQLKAGEREECLRKVDVLEYTWREGEQEMTDYAINGINIGFDGNTAILAHDLKELPLVHGTGSYLLAVLVNLVKKKGTDLQVFADGKEIHNGPLMLATAADRKSVV